CFFFQAEDGIRDKLVTGVQTCALPISGKIPLPDFMSRAAGESGVTQSRCLRLLLQPPGNRERALLELLQPDGKRLQSSYRQTARSEERRVGKECRSRR